ncbi:protein of unknown function (plasmid) [Cupriavidus taiwanensis]|nr:protein of unknown function [Cupriavidus taiwanensis]
MKPNGLEGAALCPTRNGLLFKSSASGKAVDHAQRDMTRRCNSSVVTRRGESKLSVCPTAQSVWMQSHRPVLNPHIPDSCSQDSESELGGSHRFLASSAAN